MEQREAIVAVVRRGARVLVIQRGPLARLSGYWAPLSGKLEPGETQEEAVVREVHEEVGLRAFPLAKVWESQTEDGTFRLHWWTVEAEEGEVLMHPGEVSDARWVTPREFSRLQPVFEADRVFFDCVLTPRVAVWAVGRCCRPPICFDVRDLHAPVPMSKRPVANYLCAKWPTVLESSPVTSGLAAATGQLSLKVTAGQAGRSWRRRSTTAEAG
jgi:8-oxo-dGTP pyrophosphatase MutT (NUDIX family)